MGLYWFLWGLLLLGCMEPYWCPELYWSAWGHTGGAILVPMRFPWNSHQVQDGRQDALHSAHLLWGEANDCHCLLHCPVATRIVTASLGEAGEGRDPQDPTPPATPAPLTLPWVPCWV